MDAKKEFCMVEKRYQLSTMDFTDTTNRHCSNELHIHYLHDFRVGLRHSSRTELRNHLLGHELARYFRLHRFLLRLR